ncbi:hypothetical protein [Brachybacterium sacelli]|uniref:hypothetical protein n=1 Tax=Brachybacterium sacelli TaxID=173364 RepID=UPI00361494FF
MPERQYSTPATPSAPAQVPRALRHHPAGRQGRSSPEVPRPQLPRSSPAAF